VDGSQVKNINAYAIFQFLTPGMMALNLLLFLQERLMLPNSKHALLSVTVTFASAALPGQPGIILGFSLN